MALTALSNTHPFSSSGDKDSQTSGLEDQNLPALPVQRPRGQSLYQGHAPPPTVPAEGNAQDLLQEDEIGYSQSFADVYDWSSAFPFAFDYEESFDNPTDSPLLNTPTSHAPLANEWPGFPTPDAEASVTEDVHDRVVLNPVADIEDNQPDEFTEALAEVFCLFGDSPSVEQAPPPEDLIALEPATTEDSLLSTEASNHDTPEALAHGSQSSAILDPSPQDATQMVSSLVVPEALGTTGQPSHRRKRGREDDEDDDSGVPVDAKRNRTSRVSQTTSSPAPTSGPTVAHHPAATAVSNPPTQITFLVNTAPRQIVRCCLLSFSGFISSTVLSEQKGTCQSCPAGNSCSDTAIYDNRELCPEHYQLWEGLAKLPRWTQAKEAKLKTHFQNLLGVEALVKRAKGGALRAVPPSSIIAMDHYDLDYLRFAIPEDGFKKILLWAEDVMIQGIRRRPVIGFTFPGHEEYWGTHPGVETINTRGRKNLAPGTPRFWDRAKDRYPVWLGDDLAAPV
ncbi:hypothetical protein VNI00_009506 [Paramarasmius palmivorus]|uniref:Uncharacterized protein n=1 Tax=Paramarasmius palmivorus TaxID=297713 RepID=A0AAW0CSB4_9AGAR